MGRSSKVYSIILLCAILAVQVVPSSSTAVDFMLTNPDECRGTVAECLAGGELEFEEEFAMDSESNRRILATRRYISYGALRRNTVPCSRRGASYYNCRRGAEANPYRRGCSRITRCRG